MITLYYYSKVRILSVQNIVKFAPCPSYKVFNMDLISSWMGTKSAITIRYFLHFY